MKTVYYSEYGDTNLPFSDENECRNYESRQKEIASSKWLKFPNSEGWWWRQNYPVEDCFDPEPELIFDDQLPGAKFDKRDWEYAIWAKIENPPDSPETISDGSI